jgi:hypothetical protein
VIKSWKELFPGDFKKFIVDEIIVVKLIKELEKW